MIEKDDFNLTKKSAYTFKTAFILLIVLTLVTGILYPLFITGVSQLFFPYQANGSLLLNDNIIIGSELIGQNFTHVKYFWGRPSATKPYPYNATQSGGSNLGPANPLMSDSIKSRMVTYHNADPQNQQAIPISLVAASGSGLDPHISPKSAFYQINRVAKHRGISVEYLKNLIEKHTEKRSLWFLGKSRVNVLKLNLALDKLNNHE